MHRHSIFCILPPHILIEIAARSRNDVLRRFALNTLALDTSQRQLRQLLQLAPRQRPALFDQPAELHRMIYTAGNREIRRGRLARAEGQDPSGDLAVDEAYDGLGLTFGFFLEAYGRNSIDDEGMPLDAVVHYGQGYNNAFWDGQRMVFGDGDGELFDRFTVAVDVIGHELSHGVIGAEAGFAYIGQPGALNEHVADVFGSLIKQYGNKQTADKADWLIGAGLLKDGQALRSMKEPGSAYDSEVLGSDPQPAGMDNYVRTLRDYGGVHINSGIPNRAFYLAATGIGGFAWEKAGQVWYDALHDKSLDPRSNFAAFARATLDRADRRFGANSTVRRAIAEAWAQVGIDPA